MRIFNLLFVVLLVIAVLAPACAAKPGKPEHTCAFPGKPQVSAEKRSDRSNHELLPLLDTRQ